MPPYQSNSRRTALVPWSPRVGTTPFGRSAMMREAAETVRKWCIINAAMRQVDILQPQRLVDPVVTMLLRQNRLSRVIERIPVHLHMPYLEKLEFFARFYERVLSDSQFKLHLKYWIFENRHVPV